MGRCQAELYATRDAITCFQKVIELRPEFMTARLCLAAEYTVTGDFDGARCQGHEIIRIHAFASYGELHMFGTEGLHSVIVASPQRVTVSRAF